MNIVGYKIGYCKKKKNRFPPNFFYILLVFEVLQYKLALNYDKLSKILKPFFQKMKKNLSIMFNGTDNWNTLSIATLKIRVVNF